MKKIIKDTKDSKRFTLNKTDIEVWMKNAALFAAPAMLVFFTSLQAGDSLGNALIALKLWGLNTAVDLLRKYTAGK